VDHVKALLYAELSELGAWGLRAQPHDYDSARHTNSAAIIVMSALMIATGLMRPRVTILLRCA